MNKSKLTPQDGDLFAMIREITKVDIVVNEKPGNYEIHVCVEDLPKETAEALTAAVAGRLGKRFISNETDGTAITYYCQYGDWKNYPEEIRTEEMQITPVPGTRYCRTLKEVDAIKVDRERLEDLQKFTGGGTITIPRTPGAIAKYEFKDNHGIILTAPEYSYIVREESGKIYVMDYREFIRDYEPKHIPNNWEKADKTFDRYPDGTKAKGHAGEMWVKVPGGWKDEKTGKVDPHLGANWTGEILIPSKMKEEPE